MGEQHGERDPFRVVITGGPCAGKTSVWRFMAEVLPQGVPVINVSGECRKGGIT